jgi:hypothetical protein
MATTRETALAEVRPWLGATISIAKLRVNRVDCSRRYAKEDLEIIKDAKSSTDDGIWVAIDQAFATPVSQDNESREYIPTQVIAELFKSSDKNYHGIKYKSMLVEDGFNVALFNLNHADVLDVALSKAESLKFQFSLWPSGRMTVPMPRKPIELPPAVARGFALADAIREDGNDGVHNQPLGEADALDLQDLTVELLEALYTVPGRLKDAEARRVEREAS